MDQVFFGATGAAKGYQNSMTTVALIVAGGAGSRASAAGAEPKQFREVAGRIVLERSVAPFLGHPRMDAVIVVVPAGCEDRAAAVLGEHERLLPSVAGGGSRQESVRLGLNAIAGLSPERVLIHDAARPFVAEGVIDRVIGALDRGCNAIPALPVSDTLKRTGAGDVIEATVDRSSLFAAQTPQGFRYRDIFEAHRAAAGLDREFTDDAAIAEWAGIPVSLVAGDPANRKLTTPEDFEMAERLLGVAGTREFRTGTGFDVHRFADGEAVMLCGVRIAHDRALTGHSDADVGLHALTDALLGAIGDGDIGSHFPPGDARWKGASSDRFLRHAADLVSRRGGTVVNADVTLICETPRIGPHRDAMRSRIAEILGISVARISVKATTSEGLGFTGRREGIAAQAIVSIAIAQGEE